MGEGETSAKPKKIHPKKRPSREKKTVMRDSFSAGAKKREGVDLTKSSNLLSLGKSSKSS